MLLFRPKYSLRAAVLELEEFVVIHRMVCCAVLLLLIVVEFFCTVQMTRVAIVGGGYAGLGSAYQFARASTGSTIHVYDHMAAGSAEASSVSAGIMHPMATRGKIIWNGLKGMELSLSLMNSLQRNYPNKPIYNANVQLNRLLFSETDVAQWTGAASVYPELLQINATKPWNSKALGTVVIKRAALVDSEAYLKAIWACTQHNCVNAEWIQQPVNSIDRLASEYDVVILACGGGIKHICEHIPLPPKNRISSLRLVRGQNLVLRNPTSSQDSWSSDDMKTKQQQQAYLSGEYVLPYAPEKTSSLTGSTLTPSHWLCGPTHEHITAQQYEDIIADPATRTDVNVAETQLRERITRIFPALEKEPILGVTAGTRVVTQRGELGRLPVVGRLPGFANVWVHTGFGSRGLILHALTSQWLFDAIQSGDESCIPAGLGVLA